MNIYESSRKDKAIAQAQQWIAGNQCAPGTKEIFIICHKKNEEFIFYPVADVYAVQNNLMKFVVEKILIPKRM